MPPKAPLDILQKINDLGNLVAAHIAKDDDRDKKIDLMYKVLVTGNGQPSLPETVRSHSAWIAEQEKCKDSEDKKEDTITIEREKSLLALRNTLLGAFVVEALVIVGSVILAAFRL